MQGKLIAELRECHKELAKNPTRPMTHDFFCGLIEKIISRHEAEQGEGLRAEEELQDIKDSFSRIMKEECSPDEKHCTCVPALRIGIDRIINLFGALAVEIGETPTAKAAHPTAFKIIGMVRKYESMAREMVKNTPPTPTKPTEPLAVLADRKDRVVLFYRCIINGEWCAEVREKATFNEHPIGIYFYFSDIVPAEIAARAYLTALPDKGGSDDI